jgi:excisionase family DNA binding protein
VDVYLDTVRMQFNTETSPPAPFPRRKGAGGEVSWQLCSQAYEVQAYLRRAIAPAHWGGKCDNEFGSPKCRFLQVLQSVIATPPASQPETDWVSIGRACQILGVKPATLRQWTAEGRVQVYRTPGGHRRFSSAELIALSAPRAAKAEEPVVQLLDRLRTRYRDLAGSPAAREGWLADLTPAIRSRFHLLGDGVLESLGSYLAPASHRARPRALAAARQLGQGYAALAQELSISLGQAIEAYLMFRRPLLDVLARAISHEPQTRSQLARIMRDAERFMDEVLVGITSPDRAPTAVVEPSGYGIEGQYDG